MNVMERFLSFNNNPTKIQNIGFIGSTGDAFVTKLSSFNVYRPVLDDCFSMIFPDTQIAHVDYLITRIQFRSSKAATFRVRAFDLDLINEGDFFTYICMNKLQGELQDSPLIAVEGASIFSGTKIICIHRSGVICSSTDVSRFLLRSKEVEIDFGYILSHLDSPLLVRSSSKHYPERFMDSVGPYFVSFTQVDSNADYRLSGSDYFDPVYRVEKRYFGNDLLLYLKNVQEQIIPDLEELASPDHYTSQDNVEKYLRICGLQNYMDAERIVIAIRDSSFKGLKRVLIRGEGFGFLVYHFSRYLPGLEVYGYEPSVEMRKVAASLGIKVHEVLNLDTSSYDYEIMMNVLSMGLQPLLPKVIIYDHYYLFEGNEGFVTSGGLMFRGLTPCINVLKCNNKRVVYSTAMHDGILHVEQREAAERVYNTIGAKGFSLTIKLESFGFPAHRVAKKMVDVTAFAFTTNASLNVGMNSLVPNYIVDKKSISHAFLIIPGCMDDWAKDLKFEHNGFHYIGVPSGDYNVCTSYRIPNDDRVKSFFTVKTERFFISRFKLNEANKYEVFYLNTKMNGFDKGVIFFLYPRYTSYGKLYYPYRPRLFISGKSPPFDGLEFCHDIDNSHGIYRVLAGEHVYSITPSMK